MKKSFHFILVVLGTVAICNANVWRLNNINGVDADFTTTLQAAVDSVSTGDTIYVEQSPFSYGGATISKQVILIGSGYFLTENDSTQVSEEVSKIDYLQFDVGSEGSIITGLSLDQTYGNVWEELVIIKINTNDITIQRCFLQLDVVGGANATKLLLLNGDLNNIILQQNWIHYHNQNSSAYAIHINGDTQNIVIRNNFIRAMAYSQDIYMIKMDVASTLNSPQIYNNIFSGSNNTIYTYDAIYINNILIDGEFYNGSGGSIANNLCNGTQFPDINNNQQNVDMASVFIDYDLYIDNGYFLAPDSPAIGAGANGGDCGMFSSDYGGEPYILSGMPAIPAIYEIDFNSTFFPSGSDILQVDVKAKSHN